MQRSLFFIAIIFLGGCCDFSCIDRYQMSECGNPCKELKPVRYPATTLLQAYGTSAIGKALSSENRLYAARAMQSILSDGAPGDMIEWESPDEDVSGRILVYQARQCCIVSCQPIYCRRYDQEIMVGDQTLSASGKACEDIYHIWRIVEEYPSPF
jgi:surface antigen